MKDLIILKIRFLQVLTHSLTINLVLHLKNSMNAKIMKKHNFKI